VAQQVMQRVRRRQGLRPVRGREHLDQGRVETHPSQFDQLESSDGRHHLRHRGDLESGVLSKWNPESPVRQPRSMLEHGRIVLPDKCHPAEFAARRTVIEPPGQLTEIHDRSIYAAGGSDATPPRPPDGNAHLAT
jgi:hypothetical protein